MKCQHIFFIATALLVACNNNAQKPKVASASQNKVESKPKTESKGDGIIGLWKLDLEVRDENDNNILDDAEMKKAFHNNYVYQFNANGTCRIQGVYNGTYIVKEEKGNKVLTVQRERIKEAEDEDPLPDVYHIRSQTATEMTLQIIDQAYGLVGSSYWIFKKVK